MRLVERMTQTPPRCLICGCGNVENPDGSIGPFLDMEVDVNWGDPVYICVPNCGMKMAALMGFIAPDQAKDFEAEVTKLSKELHDTKAQLEEKSRRMRILTAAKKVKKKERAGV